ncbi:uncharacterized protein LOC143283041 [Babylonia areolata]|uniref:uncharacterized protein LOC143283041 n=1 Tax=Babylonia areolata TaxID=304850 RepID=UPI003FD2F536
MPFAPRTIEPIYLGRRPLREEEKGEEIVQVALTQNAVLGALVQLASLVRHADDVFCDLAEECQKVFEETERIIHRVKRIKENVGRLDSKAVSIPVGDLKRFSAVPEHHVARHGFDCSLFTPDARPHCVKFRYSLCEVTPVRILRGADPYRKDGLHSSELFKLWPIVLREHQDKSPDLSLYSKRRGRAMTFNKKYKRLKPRSRTLPNGDSVALFHQSRTKGDDGDNVSVTSGDNGHLSRSQPSILVAVDTSGTGFHKMTSFRRSLRESASLDRKSRRRTMSGVPDGIMQEIEVFERGRRTSRNMPRNYSFDDLDSRKEPDREAVMMQYLDELDAKMEERAEEERAGRDAKLLKFLPCRRSRSLPRSVKLKESRSGQGVMTFEGDGPKDKPITTASSGFTSSSLSLGSAGGSSTTSSKATRRSSLSKIKSFVTGTLRPRPKSLDFDTVDILGNDADVEDDDNSSTQSSSARNLARALSPSMPDNISSLASSRESKVGPGTYYYFTSNTLPRAQARKYDFPWESLPKDWTTSVKLREISKRRKEERNSSSGNWSGSSNRQSMDSEQSSAPPYTSRTSLGRDSGRDSFGEDREDGQADTKPHVAADTGVSSFLPASPTSSDTEQWLASLALRAAAREDAVFAGSDVTQSLTRLSELTKQNIQALEDTFSPGKSDFLRLDDEVSSVYSLDQDGFYTSFHTDSGIRRSTGTLIDDDGELTPSKEEQSFLSTESSNTVDSVIFCPMGKVAPGRASSNSSGKVRPKPPVRSGSRLSSRDSMSDPEVKVKIVNGFQNEAAVQPMSPTESEVFGDLSPSDSDQETISTRLKSKTQISPRSIPSWCLFSDEDSPDSSNACLTHDSPQDAPSVSLSGSAARKGTSSGSGEGCKDLADDTWDFDSLPQRYLESKVWEEDLSDQSNSWPRSRRAQQTPTVGILKRDKSPAGSLKPKTLNFAPVVSMFDPLSPQGVEVPLNAASSTSSTSSSSDTSTAGLAFTLSHPPSVAHSRLSRSLGDMKQGPCSVTARHNTDRTLCKNLHQPSIQATSTPVSEVCKQSKVKREADMSSESSVCSSESSLLSESDSGQSRRSNQDRSSQSTLSSSSSAALSDIDSSLTYVSMSGSNSTLVLEPSDLSTPASDDLPTPVNSPVREQAPGFPGFEKEHSVDERLTSESVAVFQKASSTSCQASSSVLPVEHPKGAAHRQSLGSFAADASTEAAPASWVGEQSNVMISSADSGFGSSSSSTAFVMEHGHPKHQKDQHHHHHHHHHPQGLSQNVSTPPRHSMHERQVHCRDSQSDGTKNRRRSGHITDLPPKWSAEQRPEPPRVSHSKGPQNPAPRSDSYRAATRAFVPLSHGPKDHAHSSAGSAHRSHSSTHLTSSKSHKPLHTTASCPSTAVMADPEGVTRADSYRLAVRNTQGVVGDIATRNTSYRLATGDDDPVPDARMEAINSWERRRSAGNRDVRRMGITDIDQLKSYDSDNSSTSRGSSSSRSGKSPSRGFAGIHSSHKKMTTEVENLLRADKTPSPDLKRLSRPSSKGSNKDKEKTERRSSTYIRFDSIFEQGDSMYSSTNTLRAESVEMLTSEEALLMSDKVVGQLPPGRFRAGSSRKSVDEKATSSIFGSIKTTIKSISGGKNADKDTWKYDGSS